MVFDPNAADSDPPFWEYKDVSKNDTSTVPKGFKVRVIHAWVKMTKSEAG
jgi:hypothetical protein